ncbi:hypothetical protein DI392_03605 [Vibrio albus]|jgi:D-lyxose ketol-isomerase|uniref:Uncharacterized protein n=1 Tax=Vibrio albus TaxID=2200953 RepID=A0A2U3BF07_9VIBR|nr:hypothetical protein [Vibrio albus]PWI35359.1 hypothetical protein DI392_03605 [Vibrio albus]
MSNIYKIETFCESHVTRIADSINKSGGNCIIRGWAVLTDHVFNAQEAKTLFPMVSRTTDDLTEDDIYVWMKSARAAA